jgi:hypothetical protein
MGDDPMALLGLEGALKHYHYYYNTAEVVQTAEAVKTAEVVKTAQTVTTAEAAETAAEGNLTLLRGKPTPKPSARN